MITSPTDRAQSHILDLEPYRPGMPIQELARKFNLDPATIVKLASNENPSGPSPMAQEAALRALRDGHRYPDGFALRSAIAQKLNVSGDNVVLGNGSNDVLDLIARVFLGKGTEAVSSQYAFGVYQLVTKAVAAQNIVVAAKDFGHDFAAMAAAVTDQTRVIWIANPNNPTGTFAPHTEVKRFIESVPASVVIVLDEAYNEYLRPEDNVDSSVWLAEHSNLIVVRTFSKIYGLAGLRIGYGLASAEIVALLNRVRQPFNVNSVALAAAEAALADTGFVAKSRQINDEGRHQLIAGLRDCQLSFLPTYGNFVTVKFEDAAEVHLHLLKQGVIVRPLQEYGLGDYLRVTCGTADENARFLAALREALPDK